MNRKKEVNKILMVLKKEEVYNKTFTGHGLHQRVDNKFNGLTEKNRQRKWTLD